MSVVSRSAGPHGDLTSLAPLDLRIGRGQVQLHLARLVIGDGGLNLFLAVPAHVARAFDQDARVRDGDVGGGALPLSEIDARGRRGQGAVAAAPFEAEYPATPTGSMIQYWKIRV